MPHSGWGMWTQLEDSISLCIPDKTHYGQATGKRVLKLAAILQLNGECAFPVSLGCLPLVNGGWDLNSLLDVVCDRMSPRKNCLDARRIEVPLGQQPVSGQPTLQSTRGYTIEIHTVATNDGPQLVDIQKGVFDFQRIERPFHVPDTARQRLTSLFQLELRTRGRDCGRLRGRPACGSADTVVVGRRFFPAPSRRAKTWQNQPAIGALPGAKCRAGWCRRPR